MARDESLYSEKLWGKGGPYSQVQVLREIRILDDSISREIYRVYANINPKTIELLKKYQNAIKNDIIKDMLKSVEYKSKEEGYIWWVSDGEDYKEANRFAKIATDTIITMHKLVIDMLRHGHN